jgi:hypothetical protein
MDRGIITTCRIKSGQQVKKSFLENIGLALRKKPSWCLSLQAILAPFGFVIQNDPQPFGTDFVVELKNKYIENFMASLNTTTKIKLETYSTINTGGILLQPYLQVKNREIRKCVAKFTTGSFTTGLRSNEADLQDLKQKERTDCEKM